MNCPPSAGQQPFGVRNGACPLHLICLLLRKAKTPRGGHLAPLAPSPGSSSGLASRWCSEVLHSCHVPLPTTMQASPAGDVPSIQELIDISLDLGLDLRTAAASGVELSLLPPAAPPPTPTRPQLAS